MTLYPIVLLAYNRPEHTLKVLEALQQNLLISESELFVFIDGLKPDASKEEFQKHNKVIEIVKSRNWCKIYHIHVSDINRGCRFGPIFGISEVLNNHEAVIIVEDDIITSPYFLNYMNKALNYYKNYKAVFSISGYNMPESKLPIPKDYEYDVYVSLRQQNWGWGTWADRWNFINWDKSFIPNFLRLKEQVAAFNRGGDDQSAMLIDEFMEKSAAWDIQFSFNQFMQHAVSITPCFSYTVNIGFDNSGSHTLNKNIQQPDLSKAKENPIFLDVIYEDKRFINAFYSAFYPHKRPIWKKIINRLARLMGFKSPYIIKSKVYK